VARERSSSDSRRVATSDDLEVSTYLEIAEEKRGQVTEPVEPPKGVDEAILVLDFGSQYSRLIARRVREAHVYCEIFPHTVSAEAVSHLNVKGVILSGGPASVYDTDAPRIPTHLLDRGMPVLGICYGMQALTHQLGGKVASGLLREYGHAVLHQNASDHPIFHDLPSSMPVWMSHGDQVQELPPGFRALAYTENSPLAVMGNDAGIIGLQFHPEVAHTQAGAQLIANFLFRLCGCQGRWTSGNFVTESVARIRALIGDGKVICALSGGVDSAVAAALVHEAVGDQLTCIFVDNGLLRREEGVRVMETLTKGMNVNVVHVDAGNRFLAALEGVLDPEEKRRAIGETFIRVFEDAAEEMGHVDFLAQGTLYPDVIESTTGETPAAAKIKTHHNVGGLPKTMRLALVEPLRYLFKDEVREVGLAMGLPEDMVHRQPFPGPGLAIRIMGEVTEEKLEILRACDWIVMDEIKGANLYRDLWQSFAVITDVRSVGVMGDQRTYGYVAAIRAVTSDDAMTADWARLPYDVLARISTRIVNEVPQVNRVVYDITSKPPGTIEWQ
jgi:GMP synthase (glutamine-hydrolysing)